MADDDRTAKIQDAAETVAKESKSDILFISGTLFDDSEEVLFKCVRGRSDKQGKVTTIIVTPGGTADSAYRMMRFLQERYADGITALVAGWCKSAGTLCLMGASELVMGDDAELGPLDVQLARKDELGERDSGLVIGEAFANLQTQAFELFDAFLTQIKRRSKGAVTFRVATEVASAITCGLFEPIYRQIDPIRIGDNARSLAVAEACGRRLNVSGRNLKPSALENLARGYPSHGFVIDRREAETLFQRVRTPTDAEQKLLNILGTDCVIPADRPNIRFLDADTTGDSDDAADVKKAIASPGQNGKRRAGRARKNPKG